MQDLQNNALAVGIVSGTISAVVGGLILAAILNFRFPGHFWEALSLFLKTRFGYFVIGYVLFAVAPYLGYAVFYVLANSGLNLPDSVMIALFFTSAIPSTGWLIYGIMRYLEVVGRRGR